MRAAKKSVTVLTAMAAVASVAAGCSSSSAGVAAKPSAAASSTVSAACRALQSKYPTLVGKTLDVGTSPGPGNYDLPGTGSDPNKVRGVEPDILDAAGACLGFTTKDVLTDFTGLIPAIQADRIQVISAGMYATSERAKQVNFVEYMTAATGTVIAKGNPKKIDSLADLCGDSAAEVVGTVEDAIISAQSAKCTAAGKPGIKAAVYSGNDAAINAVRQGRSDIFLTDAGVAAYISAQYPSKLQVGFHISTSFVFGFAVSKKNTALLNGMHAALAAMYADGSLAAIEKKWGFAASQLHAPDTVTS